MEFVPDCITAAKSTKVNKVHCKQLILTVVEQDIVYSTCFSPFKLDVMAIIKTYVQYTSYS